MRHLLKRPNLVAGSPIGLESSGTPGRSAPEPDSGSKPVGTRSLYSGPGSGSHPGAGR